VIDLKPRVEIVADFEIISPTIINVGAHGAVALALLRNLTSESVEAGQDRQTEGLSHASRAVEILTKLRKPDQLELAQAAVRECEKRS
jgi:hypothetical protein